MGDVVQREEASVGIDVSEGKARTGVILRDRV